MKRRAKRCQSEKEEEKTCYKNIDKDSKTVYQQRNGNHIYFCRSDFGEQAFYLHYRILENKSRQSDNIHMTKRK